MAGPRNLLRTLLEVEREAERARQIQLRVQQVAQHHSRQVQHKQEQAQRAEQQAAQQQTEEQKRFYQASRQAATAAQNQPLLQQQTALAHLLLDVLTKPHFLDLNALRKSPQIPPFDPGPLGRGEPAPRLDTYLPPEPTGLKKLAPGAMSEYNRLKAQAQQRYEADLAGYRQREATRQAALSKARQDYDQYVRETLARQAAANAEIERFQQNFIEGEPNAILTYFALVLDTSVYPEGFPQKARLAYQPATRQLVVELDLPGLDVIPQIKSYSYNPANDQINQTAFTPAERESLYASVVAQVALRTLFELFSADRLRQLETVILSGYVESLDKTTGHFTRQCLVAVRAEKASFMALNLSLVEPVACLQNLAARLSPNPAQAVPVEPLLNFDTLEGYFRSDEQE